MPALPTLKKINLTHVVILLGALLPRALLWNNHPFLSTDVFRYIWDGNLLLNKINPLAFAPTDPHVAFLQKVISLPADHTDIQSVYPPLSLLYFGLISWIHSSPIAFEITATFLDVFSTYFLLRALQNMNRSIYWVLLFALHPLLIIESGHNGHVESLGLFFLSLSLFFSTKKSTRVSFWIACCGLVKLWPVVLLAPLFKKEKRSSVWALLLFLFMIGGAFWHAGNIIGVQRFASTWQFHSCFDSILQLFLLPETAHKICFCFFGMVVLWKIFRPTGDFVTDALHIVGAFLLLSPTVHPWYALWLLPLLVMKFEWEWFYVTLAVASAYAVLPEYLSHHVWKEDLWPRWFTYAPVLVGLFYRHILPKCLRLKRT